MGFISYITATTIFILFGCSNYLDSAFIELVNKDYGGERKDGSRVITGLTSYRNTCIYGNPNTILKSRIDKIYQFLDEEFHGFSEYTFTQNLEDCPTDTLIYIYLYTYPFKRKELKKHLEIVTKLQHEFFKVMKRNKTKTSENAKEIARSVNPWGTLITYGDGRRSSNSFIAINQGDFNELITEKDKNDYTSIYNSILTEELFQAITYGRDHDIARARPISSLLYEKDNIDLNGTELSTMSEFWNLKPSGFCEYDLWHLIMSDKIPGITDKLHSPEQWTLNRYKEEFIKNYSEIKIRSSKIINNPKYSDLFDPLCSGDNRGANSKVGL